MRTETRDKIIVLAVSFGLFLGGVAALGMERGGPRTALLAACMAGLFGMAVRQTRRLRRRRGPGSGAQK